MENIGMYLKQIRNERELTLKDVYKRCGVTDSRLSRYERGEGKPLNPMELKKIAEVYEIGVVETYILAGYLDENDLKDYQLVFKNANLLDDEEKTSIQTQIDLLIKKAGRKQ